MSPPGGGANTILAVLAARDVAMFDTRVLFVKGLRIQQEKIEANNFSRITNYYLITNNKIMS